MALEGRGIVASSPSLEDIIEVHPTKRGDGILVKGRDAAQVYDSINTLITDFYAANGMSTDTAVEYNPYQSEYIRQIYQRARPTHLRGTVKIIRYHPVEKYDFLVGDYPQRAATICTETFGIYFNLQPGIVRAERDNFYQYIVALNIHAQRSVA